jgi:bifunctional DNA-binding transcriptional regulator/antitoxin component of YhaV-PrlF toxin-antitoxin module
MGDRGRIVVPIEARERSELVEGTPLVLLETPGGLVLMTRPQLRDRVRRELQGLDLVTELLAERRSASLADDAT